MSDRVGANARSALGLGAVLVVALGSVTGGCSDSQPSEEPRYFSRDALLDPETCKECHPKHYDEWSGSMHAYAAEDPVFLAMNARGQRETQGKLGDFCVRCHAPMALAENATHDGLDLPNVPRHLRGVTCYFCHNVTSVDGSHNNPLVLANDTTLRGAVRDPLPNRAHGSAYSALMDREDLKSSSACGACHDLQITSEFGPADVHLERTFAEWQGTLYNSDGEVGQRCGTCHMQYVEDVIADYPGVGRRLRHLHDMPGVDVALTDFPNRDAQRLAVQDLLDRTLRVEICVNSVVPQVQILLENVFAGHHWPSGAAQDRRAWVEIGVYAGAEVLYESGFAADDEDVTALEPSGALVFRDRTFKVDGTPAHMFWEVARLESNTIPGAITTDPTRPEDYFAAHFYRIFPETRAFPRRPDRVSLRVRLRPIGVDVLRELSSDLPAELDLIGQMPVFTLSPARAASPPWSPDLTVEWNAISREDPRYGYNGGFNNTPADCVTTGGGRR
ncbi:MAG TPA: multiheme c-type cytochrome [Polyangiaceae bacterium]